MNQINCIHHENNIKCSFAGKRCYGKYCWKHRKNYLLDETSCIILDRFTGVSKDYTYKELKYFCNRFIKPSKETSKFKKNEYFTIY